eukprot:COSAG02_NODE_1756_length_11052_cov_5.309230_3_plen_67_part_00
MAIDVATSMAIRQGIKVVFFALRTNLALGLSVCPCCRRRSEARTGGVLWVCVCCGCVVGMRVDLEL